MDSIDFGNLEPVLKDKETANGDKLLYSYLDETLQLLTDLRLKSNDSKEEFPVILDNLNKLIDFYFKEENLHCSASQLSTNVCKTLAKDYVLTFGLLEKLRNSSLFDTANKIITLLVGNDKKNSLFTGNPSEGQLNRQLMLIVVLQQLFESYSYDLISLVPILIQYCYKTIKNVSYSSKYFLNTCHASVEVSTLLVKILRNTAQGTIDDNTRSKMVKVIKPVIKLLIDTNKDVKNYNSISGVNLPITLIANCYEILAVCMNEKYSTIKEEKDKNSFISAMTKDFNNYIVMGLACNHEQIRRTTCKVLAELLFKNLKTKQMLELSHILKYYYNLYVSNDDLIVRTSVFVSLTQFFSLSDLQNRNMLLNSFFPLLDNVIRPLIDNQLLNLQNYNNYKTFQQIHWFFSEFYFPNLGQVNKKFILEKLINNEYLNNEIIILNNSNFVQILLQILELLLHDLGPTVSDLHDQVRLLLLKLVGDKSFKVRVQAINTFLEYCKHFPEQVQSIMNHCLNEIQVVFLRLSGNASAAAAAATASGSSASGATIEHSHVVIDLSKVHGYSNCIAFLIKNIDHDYVSQDVIARTLTFASSQLKSVSAVTSANVLGSAKDDTSSGTDSSKKTAGGDDDKKDGKAYDSQVIFNKKLISWTLLTGLMNVDGDFLKIHVSQFFIFWKNLLTHNNFQQSEDELYKDLEIRNYALTALLNFLNNMTITPEISKQCLYLLAKSLTYVNSSLFQMKEYKEYLSERQREEVKGKETVIHMNKKRILQCYIKLFNYIKKNDINSSILIFALKNFSNPEIFNDEAITAINVLLKDKERDKEKERKVFKSHLLNVDKSSESVGDDLNNDDLYLVADGLSYGLTSKLLHSGVISELNVKYKRNHFSKSDSDALVDSNNEAFEELENDDTVVNDSDSLIEWIDQFEDRLLHNPFTPSISYDYLLKVYDERYSDYEEFSYDLVTSIVDLSIEIFQENFPYLSSKIQQSLLEQMRGNIFNKKCKKLRKKAIIINCSIALNGLLNNCRSDNVSLETNVTSTIMETLKLFSLKDSNILKINANSIGLISSQLGGSTVSVQERIEIYVNNIINDKEPFSRSLNALVLSEIFKENSTNFAAIFDVIHSLLNDPHPIVHYYSLVAMINLIDYHKTLSLQCFSQLLDNSLKFMINDEYTKYKNSTLDSNFGTIFSSEPLIIKLISSMVVSLGPSIAELKPKYKKLLRSLLYGFMFTTSYQQNVVLKYCLSTIENLMIFDKSIIQLSVYQLFLQFLLKNNLKTYLGCNLISQTVPIFVETNEVATLTSSKAMLNQTINCYIELIKIYPVTSILTGDIVKHLWICVESNPSSKTLQTLVRYFMESSMDIKWFHLLNDLYKVNRNQLYNVLYDSYRSILTKHDKVEINVDIKDEEVESMAKTGDDDGNGSTANGTPAVVSAGISGSATVDDAVIEEPSSHKFKIIVLNLLTILLRCCKHNAKLHQQLQLRIQDLVKISFNSATSSIMSLRLLGIKILGEIILIFKDCKDPLYENISLLEQQQAQITAALTPAFNSDSSAILASEAINVCAKFVGSNILPVEKCGRIFNVLINSLEQFSNASKSKIGDVEILTNRGKKRIQLSILNSWAELRIATTMSHNTQNRDVIDRYLDILVPMWILTLREYSNIKYGLSDLTRNGEDSRIEVKLYESVWINLVEVVGCIIEEKETYIHELLDKDAESFFFILFAQCIESFSKSRINGDNKVRVLTALSKLLHSKITSDILFQDEVFTETVDLFDRSILVSDNDEEKSIIIDIISGLFLNYFNSNQSAEDFTDNIDKLFELLRVILIAVMQIIPFINDDVAVTTSVDTMKPLTDLRLSILRKSFSSLVEMIEKTPVVMKVDLFSSLLYIFSNIYNNKNGGPVVTIILTNLKSVLTSLFQIQNYGLINFFYQCIKGTFNDDNVKNSVLTLMVLVTSAGDCIKFDDNDIDFLVDHLVHYLIFDKNELSLAIQSIKSLILYGTKVNSKFRNGLMVKLVNAIVTSLIENKKTIEDPRLVIELLMVYCKQFPKDNDAQLGVLFSILIPLITFYVPEEETVEAGPLRNYLHEKLLFLVTFNAISFKLVVNEVLNQEQKLQAETLVKFSLQEYNAKFIDNSIAEASPENHIELKKFDE